MTYLDINTFQASFYSSNLALRALVMRMIGFVQGDVIIPIGGDQIIDTSKPSFNLSDPAAVAANITFAGGTLDLTNAVDPNNIVVTQPVMIEETGAFINTVGTTGTFTGVISGDGGLVVLGQGTLVLTGANTYQGGTLVTDSSTLQIARSDSLGTGSLALSGGRLLAGAAMDIGTQVTLMSGLNSIDTGGYAVTLNGIVSGSGSFVKSGDGTLTLTGANSYLGGTIIARGALRVSSDENLGDSSGALGLMGAATLVTTANITSARAVTLGTGGGTFAPDTGTTLTLSGTITGAGDLVKDGLGTLILLGANDFGGGTTINAGILQIGNGGTSGSIIGDIAVNQTGTLIFNASGNGVLSGNITGAGGLVKDGDGTLTLTGTNNFGGGTTINDGALQIGNGGTSGTITGDIAVNQNAALIFNSSSAGTFAGTISGAGGLLKDGDGTLALTGANEYLGGTVIARGALRVSSDENLGDSSGALGLMGAATLATTANITSARAITLGTGGGTFAPDTGTTLTLSGTITGAGGLVKDGLGTLILLGANDYGGGTTINAGTLQLGNGGTSGTITGDVAVNQNGTLAFNYSGSYIFAGDITGTGTVSFIGGTVQFSNPNAYGGTIVVDGSTLTLQNGSSSGASYAINDGGVIGGNATIGGLEVNSGGTAAPGNSPGTITVNGTVAFNAGSLYRVDVTPTGQHDLITATGAVTIDPGASVQVAAVPGVYVPNSTYTILSGASVTGTFGSVTSDYAFLTPTLSYDSNEVFLVLAYKGVGFAPFATTSNQIAVANAAEALGLGNPVFDAIIQLPVSDVSPALNALSGEVYASTSSVIQQQSIYVRDAVTARLRQSVTTTGAAPLSSATNAAAPATAQLGPGLTPTLWAQGYGGWGDTFSNGNAASISNSIGGFLMGADVAVLPNARVGIFGGFSQSQFDMDARSSSGSMDNYDLGLYGAVQFGAWGLRGGLSYAWHDVSVGRTVAFPGVSQTLDAGYTLGTTQLFGEVSYASVLGQYAFEPFVGLAYVATNGASATETGGYASLGVEIGGFETLYTTLGLRMATSLRVMEHTLTPSLSLGWQHAFGDTTPSAALLFQGGTTPFQLTGTPIAQDAVLLGAGLSYALSDVSALSVNYNGQLASAASQNAFTAQFSLKF
ncbi:autotransporter outer membrane beta-barrel domain-containing protein [Aquabacter cavernae]|uniref:autotransporter outer membrane beta-barrel domain-containing protein n=1 Tax=Aquabacter cavernae TaxID=2496029 RepID=UPI0013DFB0B7|nr:autotransporter outer membrane beta-barrel domain-containing protein [Aquabacter cavernae]